MSALMLQFHHFISAMREFAIKCRLCSVSASCAAMEEATHTSKGRTASGDSSGDESSEPSGFRGKAQI